MHRFIIQKNTEKKINGQSLTVRQWFHYAGLRDARTAWLGSYIGSDGDTYVNIFENFQNLTLLVRRLHRKSTSLFRFEEHSETGADNDSRASTGFVKNCLNPENKILKSTKF